MYIYGQIIQTESQHRNTGVSDILGPIDLKRTFHPKATEFIWIAPETFSRQDYMRHYKIILGQFEKIEITTSIFSDYNAMTPETKKKKKNFKRHKYMWR